MCEVVKAGEIVERQRRADRRLSQRAGPDRGHRLGALCPQPLAFLETLVDKETQALAINWDDEHRQGDLR